MADDDVTVRITAVDNTADALKSIESNFAKMSATMQAQARDAFKSFPGLPPQLQQTMRIDASGALTPMGKLRAEGKKLGLTLEQANAAIQAQHDAWRQFGTRGFGATQDVARGAEQAARGIDAIGAAARRADRDVRRLGGHGGGGGPPPIINNLERAFMGAAGRLGGMAAVVAGVKKAKDYVEEGVQDAA